MVFNKHILRVNCLAKLQMRSVDTPHFYILSFFMLSWINSSSSTPAGLVKDSFNFQVINIALIESASSFTFLSVTSRTTNTVEVTLSSPEDGIAMLSTNITCLGRYGIGTG